MLSSNQPVLQIQWILQCRYALLFEFCVSFSIASSSLWQYTIIFLFIVSLSFLSHFTYRDLAVLK